MFSEILKSVQILFYTVLYKFAELELWILNHLCIFGLIVLLIGWMIWEFVTAPIMPDCYDYEGQKYDKE